MVHFKILDQMSYFVILFLLLVTSTSDVRTQNLCSNGGIIQLKTQSISDTIPIDGTEDVNCNYRCHPSETANNLIPQQGITSLLVMNLCVYYGECQSFTQSGANFSQFADGQYYITQTFNHPSESNIFTLYCAFTALSNGSITHQESMTRYLTRNLPVLLSQNTNLTVDIESNFSTEFTIFHTDKTTSFDRSQFSFRKAIGRTYFPIQTNGNYAQINNKERTVILMSEILVIARFAIEIDSFTPNHVGEYFYEFPPLDLHGSFTVDSISYCEMSYYYGLVWPGLRNGESWTQNCGNLGQFFSVEGQIYLKCDLNQGFSINSECSLVGNSSIIHLILLPNLNFTSYSISDIQNNIVSILTGVTFEDIYSNLVYNQFLQTDFTYLSIRLPANTFMAEMASQIETYFLQNGRTLTYTLLDFNAFVPSNTCYCDFQLNSDFPLQDDVYEICRNRSCDCPTQNNCTCLHGYTGSGKECGADSDFDSYPDHFLNCLSNPTNPFCTQDNCPSDHNTDQLDCDVNGMGDACDGPICPSGRDEYGIGWGCGVGNGVIQSETCVGGVGVAFRECGSNGVWLETNTSQCASASYGSPLRLCSGDPSISEIETILSNITNGIIGQVFPFGLTDLKAFSNIYACLVKLTVSKMDFIENRTFVELFINTSQDVLTTLVNQTRFIEETMLNFGVFSKSINLPSNLSFDNDIFSFTYTKLLKINGFSEYIFSNLSNQIIFPINLLNEISALQTCNSCNGLSISIILYKFDLRNLITTDNSLQRKNGLDLEYFQNPEVLADIVSVQFGNINDPFLHHSFSINFNTYSHSSAPFTLTELPSPIFCAKFSLLTSQWINKIPNSNQEIYPIACGQLKSTGIYTQLGGLRIIEDSLQPFNLIGYIGAGISLVIYTATILIYILFFKLLLKISHFINLIIAVIFTLYNILFIFTLEAIYDIEILCKISSIFMHFFITSGFIWLTAYTLVCYILISYPHYHFRKKSFLVVIITSITFSLLLVFPLSGVFHRDYISNSTFSPNILEERLPYCWVNTQNIRDNYFIWLLAAPLVILYILCIIILALALLKDAVSSFGLKSSKKLLRVLSIYVILFGINWALCLGYLSTNNSIIAYIFAVSNTFQAIFFLFGVILIPHQDLHRRIEYYVNPKFVKNIRWPEFKLPTRQNRRVITQAELAIRTKDIPIITDDFALIASSEDSLSDNMISSSVNFSRLLKGHEDDVTENEIDIMDPSTFAPAVDLGDEEPRTKIRPRMKVLTEVIIESDSSPSEDSKEQELAIYYPVSFSSQSDSVVNAEVLADQIDHLGLEENGRLLDAVVSAESGEMVDQSELIVQPGEVKFAEIVDVETENFQETPPSKRAPKKPNKIVDYWEKKILAMDRSKVVEGNDTRRNERFSTPAYIESHYDEGPKFTRMMLPSGRMVTATPPPSEPEENQTYSMPELIYLQSRSFTPGTFDALRKQASFDINDSQTSVYSESTLTAPAADNMHRLSSTNCSDTTSVIEQELVADLDTLITHVDTEAQLFSQ